MLTKVNYVAFISVQGQWTCPECLEEIDDQDISTTTEAVDVTLDEPPQLPNNDTSPLPCPKFLV